MYFTGRQNTLQNSKNNNRPVVFIIKVVIMLKGLFVITKFFGPAFVTIQTKSASKHIIYFTLIT